MEAAPSSPRSLTCGLVDAALHESVFVLGAGGEFALTSSLAPGHYSGRRGSGRCVPLEAGTPNTSAYGSTGDGVRLSAETGTLLLALSFGLGLTKAPGWTLGVGPLLCLLLTVIAALADAGGAIAATGRAPLLGAYFVFACALAWLVARSAR